MLCSIFVSTVEQMLTIVIDYSLGFSLVVSYRESYLVKLVNKLLRLIRKMILFLSTYIIITVLCSIAEGGRLGNNYLLLRIYVCDVFGIS